MIVGTDKTKAWPANQACCSSLASVYFWRSVGKAESVSNPHISQLYLPHHVPRAAVILYIKLVNPGRLLVFKAIYLTDTEMRFLFPPVKK